MEADFIAYKLKVRMMVALALQTEWRGGRVQGEAGSRKRILQRSAALHLPAPILIQLRHHHHALNQRQICNEHVTQIRLLLILKRIGFGLEGEVDFALVDEEIGEGG